MGLQRIHIEKNLSGRGSWRFDFAQARWPAASQIYRQVFARLGMPLLPGDQLVRCTKEEFMAGYDHELGIDVLLKFESGMTATLQEKFLTFPRATTVTVEYMQNPETGEQGDWFTLKCQYYFVGYDTDNSETFNDWILLDWPAVQRATLQGRIQWHENRNRHDGARASFRYAYFDEIPPDCIVARYGQHIKSIQPILC